MKVIKQFIKKILTDSVVQIEPTRRCNFNCAHCTHKGNRGDMEIDLYRHLLAKHSKCGLVKQGLGEPLLHPNIQQLINIAKDSGHKVMIITNGSFQHENVDHYVFSLETMNHAVYESVGKRNLSTVINNIRYAASIQKVTINCVQCYKTTPQDVLDVQQFASEIGADIWITPQEVWVDPSHESHAAQVANTKTAWRIHGIDPAHKKYRVYNWGVREFYYDYTGASHPCCIRMTDEYKEMKPRKEICSHCPL